MLTFQTRLSLAVLVGCCLCALGTVASVLKVMPEVMDPRFLFEKERLMTSQRALASVQARSGARAYSFSADGRLSFRLDKASVPAEALLKEFPDLENAVGQIREVGPVCSTLAFLEDRTSLCQRWQQGGKIGGWATWGRTGVGEARRQQVTLEEIDSPWFWWSANDGVLKEWQ